MYITSKAKIFVIDDLSYETSDADDLYCGIDPSSNRTGTAEEAAEGDEAATSGATWSHSQRSPMHMWATAAACVCCAGLLWHRTAGYLDGKRRDR